MQIDAPNFFFCSLFPPKKIPYPKIVAGYMPVTYIRRRWHRIRRI